MENKLLELLEKAAHYWKDKDPAKYKKMLNKLKRDRKTPGHKERAQQQILQAKRRERGGKGTKTGNGHNGKMDGKHSTKVKQYQSSEKKAGTKLSPDRKDNSKGYQSGNVRNVPQNLNRGRHNVDEKKLADWKKKKKLKKSEIDELEIIVRSKLVESGNEEILKALDVFSFDKILEKMYQHSKTGKWMLEDRDEAGLDHPEDDRRVSMKSSSGLISWGPSEEETKKREGNFVKAHAEYIKNNNLSDNGKAMFNKLVNTMIQDPDRHIERTSFDDTNGGLRMRHLYHVMTGNPDYSIREKDDGLAISAKRHIPGAPMHTWHFDGDSVKPIRRRDLKKTGLDTEDFVTLLRAKILEKGDEELADLVNIIDIERFIDNIPANEDEETVES